MARAKPRRWLALVTVGIALGLLSVVFAARCLYPRLLYPAPSSDRFAPGEGRLLTVQAADGVAVHATALDGPNDAPVVVYFHGNGVAMGDMLWMAREFRQRGLGVVLAEYRGYGLSAAAAAPSESGLYADAEAILTELGRAGVSPQRIVLLGESLGTGVAVEMAARGHGAALVLLTPYTSIPETASRFVLGVPVGWLMHERFDSQGKAGRVKVPTLILHGTRDGVVPYAMGQQLAKSLPRARLVTVQNGHHNDLFLGEGARLFDVVADFVREPR